MEMPLLICRCCGGELRIDEAREQIVCDYCGEQWGLAALLADTPPLRGGEEEPLHTEMQIYYYAVKRLHASRTVEDCVRLAADFETTPELPDSEALLARCREKAAQLQKERLYLGALARMHSTRPVEAAQAVSWLRQLGDYKDAAAKCAEAEHFLRAPQKSAGAFCWCRCWRRSYCCFRWRTAGAMRRRGCPSASRPTRRISSPRHTAILCFILR